MITVELLQSIDRLLPGADERSQRLRTLVRLLADAGGRLSTFALALALQNDYVEVVHAARGWEGVRWRHDLKPVMAVLSPWVRQAVGLPVDTAELLSDLADDDEPSAYHRPVRGDTAPAGYGTAVTTPHADPLAGVRGALARCKNVSTPAEALAHAYPETEVISIRPAVPPRDCPGTPA